MIYLTLFLAFLKIGFFAFGGAYGAIPLIQETALAHGWMDEAMFSNIIAVSESTPGPIMVNTATYIGSRQGGIPGAVAATLGVVLPSFMIILLVSSVFKNMMKNKTMQAALKGVKPCLMGVILATGIHMAVNIIVPGGIYLNGIVSSTVFSDGKGIRIEGISLFIFLFLIAAMLALRWIRKKELSPIMLIVLAGVLGAVLY